MALQALEDQVGPSAGMTAPELLLALHWLPFRTNGGKLPSGLAAGPTLTPVANHGRWVVRCPFCPSANRASRKDPRFFCCECSNAEAGGKWLPVAWPPDTAAIEALLDQRPYRHNRNWMPGETPGDLAAENAALAGGRAL